MKNSFKKSLTLLFVFSLTLATFGLLSSWDGLLVEWATMREAIGQGQHQARGTFAALNSKPHLFAVGAVVGLKGEATVFDGHLTATEVTCCGNLLPVEAEASKKLEGTYVLGAYIENWETSSIESPLDSQSLEDHLRATALGQPWKNAPAFPFLLEGELTNVKLHVINGVCPLHARLNQIEIAADKKPYEANYERLQGRVVGFFADKSVGVRTHPDTSLHAHVIFKDPASGKEVTGHLERFSLGPDVRLRLPR